MSKLSLELSRLLVIRGVARALAPLAVLWGIADWLLIDWRYGLIYAALTINYVIVYILSWVASGLMQGPWRVRAFQTFILIINFFLLPIVFRRTFGRLPWGFIAINVLFFIGLYAAAAILMYLQEKLPMRSIFMARKAGVLPTPSHPHETTAVESE